MKKRILIFSLFAVAFFMGFTNVEAETYTSYKAGDKITVNVNDSTKLDFYVIADSDDENVTAIYDGVLGETFFFEPTTNSLTGSTAQTKLNELTAGWDNPSEIRLITVSEINPNLELSKDLDGEISTSSYYHVGASYWTQDVVQDGGQYYPVVVTNWYNFSTVAAVVDDGAAHSGGGSIRPVITVSKDHVVGGTYISEEEKVWNSFVEAFKKTELVKMYTESESNTVNITNTSDSLQVVLSDGTNSWTTNFTYANGIVTYVPSDNEENMMIDSIWIYNCMYALADIKGYNIDEMLAWSNEDGQFTLAKDGVEFQTKRVSVESESSVVNGSISSDAFASFKLDIKNGLKSFSNSKNASNQSSVVVKVPDTGINLSTVIIITISCLFVVVGGTIYCVNVRKFRKNTK